MGYSQAQGQVGMEKIRLAPNDQVIQRSTTGKTKTYLYLISVIAAVGGFLLTYDIIIMSGAIIFLRQYFHLTATQVGFAMTSAILACFFSPSLGGWVADRLGRKTTLITAAAIFALSALGTAFPRSITE
ncbi:MAG: MFS transporter, partial [Terriglobales bacterium]